MVRYGSCASRSTVIAVWAVLCMAAVRVESCTSSADCSMAGHCTSGKCECIMGFTGPQCGTLAMESYQCGRGGLCLVNGSATWGGSVVQDDDGDFHMFAAMMTRNETLQAWLTNSVVLHAVSSRRPEGPYVPTDISLAPRAVPHFDSVMIHNPDAKRAPDGQYVLFYDGSSKPPAEPAARVGKDDVDGTKYNPIILRQKIGLATSSSPHGPWMRRNTPILEPTGVNGTWDQLFVTNPAGYIFPNGSALLVYKSGRSANWPSMYMGVAFADHYGGPYRRLTVRKPLHIPSNKDCEDPGIYFDPDLHVFRMVLHCGCSTQMLWSKNGVDWVLGGPEQDSGWCTDFNYTDGMAGHLTTRQRPHFVLDQTGRATHLTTGVNRPGDGAMGHTWTMAAKLT